MAADSHVTWCFFKALYFAKDLIEPGDYSII